MKIRLNPNREAGVAIVAWLLVVLFVIFIIIIFGVAYTCIKTIQKIVPPPDPDPDGRIHMPVVGDKYGGGTVTGYAPPPHLTVQDIEQSAPPGFAISRVYIFADNSPRPAAWTNCIWQGDLLDVTNAIGSNGLPMEFWPAGQMPSQRFYNIVVSNSNQ
jgi:hypothetical protein